MVSLKLLSSMATRELLAELLSAYQRSSGQAVAAEAGGGIDVARRLQAGEPVDVVVLASTAIDKLIGEGRVRPGRVDLARSGVGIAVRAGTTSPDVSTEEAVKRAAQSARSVSYSTGPSGVHLEKLFERWDIVGELRGRIVVPPPGTPVASLVASGAVELGFQQLSELLNVPGVQVVGPLPPPIQSLTTFAAGIATVSAHSHAARALLDYLASPATAAVKQRHGMEAPV
jgi:molybdate transport system substrate-binding protein